MLQAVHVTSNRSSPRVTQTPVNSRSLNNGIMKTTVKIAKQLKYKNSLEMIIPPNIN
jgi:hypothetical protein